MSTKANLRIAGLATDPNPLTTGEAGALRQAYDVICRDGVAEPRPSFDAGATTKSTTYRPTSMYVFDSGLFIVSYDGSTWRIETLSGTVSGHTEAPQPLDSRISLTQWAEARQNLYYTTAQGVWKLTSYSDTSAAPAGMLPATNIVLSALAGGAAVLNNTSVAYRHCFRRLTTNNVVLRSAPSPWQQVTNTSGGTVNYSIAIALEIDIEAGDYIEVYRSQPVASGSTPSDILQLTLEYKVTAADVTAGTVTLTDRTLAADLTRELYTNPTREGALAANYPPPVAAAIASWSGCMWYGNTRTPHEIELDINLAIGNAGSNTTITYQNGTGNTTNGNPTILGIASTNGMHVGMLVSEGTPRTAGVSIPVGAKIISVGANSITMDKNATATVVGQAFTCHDIFSVTPTGGSASEFYAGATYSASATTFAVSTSATSESANARAAARSLAALITETSTTFYAWAIEDTTASAKSRPGQLFVQKRVSTAVAGSSFTAAHSFRDNSPNQTWWFSWGEFVDTSTLASYNEQRVNRVYYSKPDEPEHVPLLNWIAVGNEAAPIYTMVPTKDALIVFKRDGIFSVSGSAPQSWRVDQISGVGGLFGQGACEYDGVTYAITTNGFVAIEGRSVRVISDQRISREINAVLSELAGTQENQADPKTTWGIFCVPMARKGCVLFGLPATSSNTYADRIYCYHLGSGAWSRWDIDAYHCAASRAGGFFYLARYGYWEVRRARLDGESSGYDRLYSVSAWTYVAGTPSVEITDANLGNWEPKAGDWVSCVIGGTTYYRQVTAVTDPGVTKLLTIDSAFPSGAQSTLRGYDAVLSVIEWQPFASPDKYTAALITEQQVTLDLSNVTAATADTARFTMGARNDRTSTRDTITVTETRSATEPQSIVLRSMMGRNVARLAHCYPYFSAANISYPWILTGCALVFSGESERVNR